MSVMSAEQRGDLAEAMIPVAANLVTLVHGDGGPEDVQEVLAGLDAQGKDALLIVLAGLVDPDQPISKALGWLEFTEDRDLAVPPWSEKQRVRDLVPEPVLPEASVDPVAVRRFVEGFGVETTEAEWLEGVRQCAAQGMSNGDIDVLRDVPAGTTEKVINRIRKAYMRSGRVFPLIEYANKTTRLSDEQVVEIRELYAAGGINVLELALRYNVVRGTITHLLSGRSYRDVGGPIRPSRTPAAGKGSRVGFAGHTAATEGEGLVQAG